MKTITISLKILSFVFVVRSGGKHNLRTAISFENIKSGGGGVAAAIKSRNNAAAKKKTVSRSRRWIWVVAFPLSLPIPTFPSIFTASSTLHDPQEGGGILCYPLWAIEAHELTDYPVWFHPMSFSPQISNSSSGVSSGDGCGFSGGSSSSGTVSPPDSGM